MNKKLIKILSGLFFLVILTVTAVLWMNSGSNNETNNETEDENTVAEACAENPFLISTAEMFKDLINQNPQCHFELTSDITFSGIHSESVITQEFTGVLDGQGYTIFGLTIQAPAKDSVGLFSTFETHARVQNVSLANFDITGERNVGSLVGRINFSETATLKNITVQDSTVTANTEFVGGLIGTLLMSQNIQVSDIQIKGVNIEGIQIIGGILGVADRVSDMTFENIIVENLTSQGSSNGSLIGMIDNSNNLSLDTVDVKDIEIEGNQSLGGLIGYNLSSGQLTVSNISLQNIKINAENGLTGGLVAALDDASLVSISNIQLNNLDISGGSGNYVGGLIGLMGRILPNHDIDIIDVNLTDVNVSGNIRVGGLIGLVENIINLTIKDILSTRVNVTATDLLAGGLLGFLGDSSQVQVSHIRLNEGFVKGLGNVAALMGVVYRSSLTGSDINIEQVEIESVNAFEFAHVIGHIYQSSSVKIDGINIDSNQSLKLIDHPGWPENTTFENASIDYE